MIVLTVYIMQKKQYLVNANVSLVGQVLVVNSGGANATLSAEDALDRLNLTVKHAFVMPIMS